MAEVWRDEARSRLPDLKEELDGWWGDESEDFIGRARYFYQLCMSLAEAIWTLYDKAGIIGERIIHSEPDREKIAAIYDYAWWCMAQPDLRDNVLFVFWESLGPHINVFIQRDMLAFLTQAQLGELQQEGILKPVKRG